MRNTLKKYIPGLIATFLVFAVQPAFAAGPPAPSLFSNPLAITFISMMLLLLIIIGILAHIVIGAAEVRLKKRKAEKSGGLTTILLLFMVLAAPSLIAQNATSTADATPKTAQSIGGMDASTF